MDDLVDSAHASHANSLIAPCEIITRGPSHTIGTCLRNLSVIITYKTRCIKERSSGLRKSCEHSLMQRLRPRERSKFSWSTKNIAPVDLVT